MSNHNARKESTLLAVIAQAHGRGATRHEVTRYEEQLQLDSSRALVNQLFNSPESHLAAWARSLYA